MSRAKKVFCVVAYDIADDKRRTRVAKALEKYGVRVNFSVFECMFTENRYMKVRQMLVKIIDCKKDTVVYYPICVNCFTKIVYQPEYKKTATIVELF